MRAVVMLVGFGLLAFAGCLSNEVPASDGGAPLACAAGGSACPALVGFAVACEGGACVARSPTGGTRVDCAGEGRYSNDLRFDARNCGACGAVCPGSATCVDGACACAPSEVRCDGACVSTATSRAHCGGCGNVCAAGARCVAGACVACAPGEVLCGNRCVGRVSGAAPCGICDRPCGDAAICVDGACVACLGAQIACGGVCVDVVTDNVNCGRCGAQCAPGFACAMGQCIPSGSIGCASGWSGCDGRCVNLRADPAHCGRCDIVCPVGGSCAAGRCACPVGFRLCDGRCVDVASDPAHCGGCGIACPAGISCRLGACVCPGGSMPCGDRCVDLATDPAHCGACGVACAREAPCRLGACVCPAGRAHCDGRCVDLQTDRRHCGRCGAVCSGTCRAGRCFPCAASSICGDACVNLSTAHAHCGACDSVCGDDRQCVEGRCVACPSGQRICAGACVDATTSAVHCGACGRACAILATCEAGRCVEPCTADTPFAQSDFDCGACGVTCAAGSLCVDGRCASAAPRLKAPISATFVSSARPWFRWELPAGADGARVEVCATRACDRVEASWEASGDRLRAPAALAPGVHHWRAYARRAGRYDLTPSLVWEFAVPGGSVAPAPGAHGVPVLHDLNADGVEDRIEVSTDCGTYPRCNFVRYGRSPTGVAPPDQRIVSPSIDLPPLDVIVYVPFPGGMFLPDVNGDGFGELLTGYSYSVRRPTGWEPHEITRWHAGSSTGVFLPGSQLDLTDFERWRAGEPVLACLGDRDGDGFGDIATWWAYGWGSVLTYSEKLGGRGAFRRGSSGSGFDVPHGIAVGDSNADGRSDLVHWLEHGHGLLTLGAARLPTLPAGREIVECPPRPYDPSLRFSATVSDVNDDGYDDLTFTVVGTSAPPVTSRMLGGPDGLSPTRCAPLP